jgi:transcription antitermination factor NusG
MIKFGPFNGSTGVVVSTRQGRVVVRVQLKKRPVLVELDTDMVEVQPKNPSRTGRSN